MWHLFTNSTKDTKRRQINEPFHRLISSLQGIHEVLCAFGIHLEEILCLDALGSTSRMYHIVEGMISKGSLQLLHIPKVKVKEIDTLILQVFPVGTLTYCSPYLKSATQSLLYYKTANEARCSSD